MLVATAVALGRWWGALPLAASWAIAMAVTRWHVAATSWPSDDVIWPALARLREGEASLLTGAVRWWALPMAASTLAYDVLVFQAWPPSVEGWIAAGLTLIVGTLGLRVAARQWTREAATIRQEHR